MANYSSSETILSSLSSVARLPLSPHRQVTLAQFVMSNLTAAAQLSEKMRELEYTSMPPITCFSHPFEKEEQER